MKLEDQVCSLDLAKRLKELGVKQESYFFWINIGIPKCDLFHAEDDYCNQHNAPGDITWLNIQKRENKAWSAFTVAELGELLPTVLEDGIKRLQLGWRQTLSENAKRRWILCYCDPNLPYEERMYFEDVNEANARALMLIHLIEQGNYKP